MSKRLVVRADAHEAIGSGHVMRMIALAQAWVEEGGDVLFVSKVTAPWLKERILSEGFSLVASEAVHPDPADADQLKELTFAEDWIVVDGYHFDTSYMQELRAAGRFTIVMDDVNDRGEYPISVLINPNADADTYSYSTAADTLVLRGPRYACLRREFVGFSRKKKAVPDSALNVLISFGASDVANMTEQVLVALRETGKNDLHVKVVLGAFNMQAEHLEELAASLPCRCEMIQSVNDMAALMDWADLCIGAAGSTCWELCYFGVPMLLGVAADNQRGIAESLADQGAAQLFNDRISPREIGSLIDDVDTRTLMSRVASELVDGEGGKRVATLKRVLLLGYGEKETHLIDELRNANCHIDHTKNRVDSYTSYDLVISHGYRHIISKRLIDQGVPIVNLHTSLLPYNRGAHPNFWAFYDDTPKGVTIHLIDEGVDTGPVIAQKEVVFDRNENSFVDTYVRLRREMEELFIIHMEAILSGSFIATPQMGTGTYHKLADLPAIEGGWSADISSTLSVLRKGNASDDDSDALEECRRCIVNEEYLRKAACEKIPAMGLRMGCQKYSGMALRPASIDDLDILLEWRNDENTRNKSFNSDVIDPASHTKWLESKLIDPRSLLLVAEVKGNPIGQIRFDQVNEEVVVSLSVAPEKAGKGAGLMMICKGCRRALKQFPNMTIVAMVRDDNHASKRVFTKAGFIVAEQIVDEFGFFLRFELRVTHDYK